MTPDKVIEHLKSYKLCVGRCAHLEIEIQRAERALEFVSANAAEIEAYHVQQYENMDMPRGASVSDPTAKAAIRIATGAGACAIRDCRADLYALHREYEEKRATVQYVEAWLSGLSEKDRWIITEQVIEGKYWREIVMDWSRRFGESFSRDHLRKLKAIALEKVCAIAT